MNKKLTQARTRISYVCGRSYEGRQWPTYATYRLQ